MGYYSTFKVEIDDEFYRSEEYWEAELELFSGGYIWEQERSGTYAAYDRKWYSWEDDIKAISRAHPGVEFTLERRSEDGEFDAKIEVRAGDIVKRFKRAWVEAEA